MKKLTYTLPLYSFIVATAVFLTPSVQAVTTTPTSPGKVRFFNNANWEFDPYLDNPSIAQQDWMKSHYYRMLVHAPYFDEKIAWYSGGLAYLDSYGIYLDDPIVRTHPEWIMKDAQGNKLYIPWACQNGACSQFAGDFSNTGFRQYMVQKMTAIMAKGYRGLWLDDVNFTWRISDGYENFVTPIDRNTGRAMTLDAWRLYFAQYLEQIRAALPNAEIAHNIIWFADAVDAQNPYINRAIDAADYINLERGGNDDGLVGGGDTWGYETFLKFVDYVHGRGADVIIMDNSLSAATNKQKLEYGLATWLLVSQGNDLLGNFATNRLDWTTPNAWWSGYDLNLGNARNTRYQWNNVLRRDFECGIALLNQPDMPTRTVTVGSGYKNLAGQAVTSVTLAAKQAAILQTSCTTPTPPVPTPAPVPSAAAVTKTFQQGVNGYTGAKDAFIYKPTPTVTTGTSVNLYLDGRSKSGALLAWDLASIPLNAVIEKVSITFNVSNSSSSSYEIYEMKRAWQENQATWRNYASAKTWATAGALGTADKGPSILGAVTAGALGSYSLNLNAIGIALVQSWVKTPSANKGLLVMDYAAPDNLMLSSKEDTLASNRPKLSVTYTVR